MFIAISEIKARPCLCEEDNHESERIRTSQITSKPPHTRVERARLTTKTNEVRDKRCSQRSHNYVL